MAGVQGALGKWDWESSVLYNQAQRDDISYGRLYLPTLRTLNTGTSLAALAANPTLPRTVINDNQAAILQLDAKANTTFGNLRGGPTGLALGVEARRETIDLQPDPELAAGNIFGLVNTIIDGERDVKSAFVELRTPFLKNFEMDFAGRVDKYPGIKANFVPKVGAKWTVMDSLALRGTYQRGFRAPALVQVTPGGAQFFQSGVFDPKRCEEDEITPKPGATAVDCAKSIAGTGGYNPDLKPENRRASRSACCSRRQPISTSAWTSTTSGRPVKWSSGRPSSRCAMKMPTRAMCCAIPIRPTCCRTRMAIRFPAPGRC